MTRISKLLFFLSLITIFYFIEADIWIKSKGLIPGQRLDVRLVYKGQNVFRLMVLSIFYSPPTKVDFKSNECH